MVLPVSLATASKFEPNDAQTEESRSAEADKESPPLGATDDDVDDDGPPPLALGMLVDVLLQFPMMQ